VHGRENQQQSRNVQLSSTSFKECAALLHLRSFQTGRRSTHVEVLPWAALASSKLLWHCYDKLMCIRPTGLGVTALRDPASGLLKRTAGGPTDAADRIFWLVWLQNPRIEALCASIPLLFCCLRCHHSVQTAIRRAREWHDLAAQWLRFP
jgi:hypothetical protein